MPYRKKEETMQKRQEKIDEIKLKYGLLSPHLNERVKRLFAGTEALSIGRNGVTYVSEATGLARKTITLGRKEVLGNEVMEAGKARKDGAGRKTILEKYPEIQESLITLIDSTIFGDPERPLQWTIKSKRTLADELNRQGFKVSYIMVGVLLEQLGYSLQTNKKSVVL